MTNEKTGFEGDAILLLFLGGKTRRIPPHPPRFSKNPWPIGRDCYEELKELVEVFPQLNNRRWKKIVEYFRELDACQHYVDTGEWKMKEV